MGCSRCHWRSRAELNISSFKQILAPKYQKRDRPTSWGDPDPAWPHLKTFRKDLSPGGTAFKWREICALELASDSITAFESKSWDFFTGQDVHQWHQSRMSLSLSLGCASVHLSSPAALFICAAATRLGVSLQEQDWHKLHTYHFLKRVFLELCFTSAFLQNGLKWFCFATDWETLLGEYQECGI